MHTRHARGFTLIELMMVLSILGAVALIAFPRVGKVIGRVELRSAKQELATALVVARAAAIQNGRAATLVRTGNVVKVQIASGAGVRQIGGAVDAFRGHKVTLSSTLDSVRFDPRGYAFGLNTATNYQVIRLTRGSYVDSVCISRFGRINASGACL